MTDTPTSQPDDSHPMRKTRPFSDYGEWLDEGTAALIEDIGARTGESTTGRASVPVPTSDYPINVVHDLEQHFYGAWLGQEPVAYLSYRLVGRQVALWSTAVLPAYRKHGVATELIARALDDIRASGRTVTIVCPVVREMINHHPQYEDLVDEEKMSTPADDSAFLSELEVEVRTELTAAEVGQPTVSADTGPTDTGPAVEPLLNPDAESYADAEQYAVSLRALLGAIEAAEEDLDQDRPL